MRNYTRSKLDVNVRRHFGGGGGGGPSGAQMAAQQRQHDEMMAMMRSQQADAQRQAAQMAANAKEQQETMMKKLGIMEQQRMDALAGQREQLDILKSQQVKPDPMAKVVAPTENPIAQQAQAARRRGMRQSILAGENENPVTGPYVLG